MTPLHWAAQNGHAEVAALLVKYGAGMSLVNKFGLTPADIAHQIGRQDIVDIANAANSDSTSASEQLALQLATDSSNDSNTESELPKDAEENCPVPIGKYHVLFCAFSEYLLLLA